MHVLLITSEDLNEKNTLGSIFELSQAKSLRQRGIQTAIISVSCYSTINVLKTIISRFSKAKYDYYRLKDVSIASLVGEIFKTFFYSLTKKTRIRKLLVQDVTVYEAVFNRFHFAFDERWHKEWVHHGYLAFKLYVAGFGKPDLIHAHSRFLLGALLADKIREDKQIKYVLTEHSSFYMRNLIKDFQFPLIKRVINNAKKFIVVSNALGKIINEKLNSSFQYSVVPNVLDSTFAKNFEKRNPKKFAFLSISSLDANKNQQLLLKAFSKVHHKIPDCVLKIGGKGPEYENLRSLVTQLGIEQKVSFIGYLSHEGVLEAMQECNVFVLPSKFETFGVVLIEAMACGKPVIATKCGGPEDIVNESNGLLVEQNEEALAQAMLKVYEGYGYYDFTSIRRQCIGKYSADVITDKIISIYKEAAV